MGEADPHYGYGYGYYRPYGYYRGYYGKRSADEPAASGPNPDADAWYGYYGRGYGYGYYRPYGYWGYYGKRSADEAPASGPNPDADADAWYGYYGHGYVMDITDHMDTMVMDTGERSKLAALFNQMTCTLGFGR